MDLFRSDGDIQSHCPSSEGGINVRLLPSGADIKIRLCHKVDSLGWMLVADAERQDIWERTGTIHRSGSWIAIPISLRALARISSCLAGIIFWQGTVGAMEVIIIMVGEK